MGTAGRSRAQYRRLRQFAHRNVLCAATGEYGTFDGGVVACDRQPLPSVHWNEYTGFCFDEFIRAWPVLPCGRLLRWQHIEAIRQWSVGHAAAPREDHHL